LKAVSIMWTEGVSLEEAQVVISAVQHLLRLVHGAAHRGGFVLPPSAIRPFGTWVVPSIPQGEPYWGVPYYVDSSFDPVLGQIVAPTWLEVVRQEPWQREGPHYDVAIVEQDLTDEPGRVVPFGAVDYTLAATLPGVATVMSVHRVRELAGKEQRRLALRRLATHNFGHVLGLPRGDRGHDVRRSFGEVHCTRRCLMRAAPTLAEVLSYAEEESRDGVMLCDLCQHDAVATAANSLFSAS
jgi:hypothetical protein